MIKNIINFITILYIGTFILYIIKPNPNVIIRYPSIKTIKDKEFFDKNGNKYKFSCE